MQKKSLYKAAAVAPMSTTSASALAKPGRPASKKVAAKAKKKPARNAKR